MSLSDYPPEPGGYTTCGLSWNKTLPINGYIEQLDYGAQFKAVLPPLAQNLGSLGEDSERERELLEHLAQTIGVYHQLIATSLALDPSEKASALWPLDYASAALKDVGRIYQGWLDRGRPLSESDYFDVERQERREARSEIRDLIVRALPHIRCAQYIHYRAALVSQAWKNYRESELTPGVLTSEDEGVDPGPEVTVGGLTGEKGGEDPADIPRPDPFPGGLPSPDIPADVAVMRLVTPPDGDEERDLDREGATPSETQGALNKAALAVGSVALGLLLWKTLR